MVIFHSYVSLPEGKHNIEATKSEAFFSARK